MQKYIEILKRTQLFSGVSDTEISVMLNCLQAKLLTFQKGDYVFREGERIDNITVLVKGKLLVQHDDFWGKSKHHQCNTSWRNVWRSICCSRKRKFAK